MINFTNIQNKARLLFFILGSYLILWGGLHYVLTYYFPNSARIPSLFELYKHHHSVLKVINDINFWSTSAGVMIYALFEILIVSGLLNLIGKVLNYETSFNKALLIVILSHLIFLVQHIAECIFVIKNTGYFSTHKREQFSLYSISYFLNVNKISFSPLFSPLFISLSFFEIIFWSFLFLWSKVINKVKFADSAKLVTLAYLIPLFLWILILTFLTLLRF